MYGVHVYGQIVLFESKGFLLSTFVVLWLIILLSFFLNNLFQQFYTITSNSMSKKMLLFFIGYTFLNSLINIWFSGNTYSMVFIFSIILPAFLLGFLCNVEHLRNFILKRILLKIKYEKRVNIYLTIISTSSLLFIIYQISLYRLDFNFGLFSFNNEFYQSIGDYYIILYCGMLGIRDNSTNSSSTIRTSFRFNFIIIVEIVFSIFLLQLVGSNKAPLTIVLIGFLYLYYNVTDTLKYRFRHLLNLFIIFILIYIFCLRVLDLDMVSGLRFFSEAQDESILNNSSWVSRISQWSEAEEIFSENLFFGDINSVYYIHSSIATLLSHTGLIGFMLFSMFFGVQVFHIYFRRNDKFLKAITLPIVFISVISSVFWWLPLWFLSGLMYARK